MHRFWFFPLILGVVGALYPFLSTVEAWLTTVLAGGHMASASDINDALYLGGPIGAAIGIGVGLLTAWMDLLSHGAQDRNGFASGRRLVRSLLWLCVYSVLLVGVNAFLIGFVGRNFVPYQTMRYWFPGLLFPFFGALNLAAISWAVIRAPKTEDVLSPRVVGSKLRRSTTIMG